MYYLALYNLDEMGHGASVAMHNYLPLMLYLFLVWGSKLCLVVVIHSSVY